MKIVVLNGSPKGDTSVTMQYVRFIQKKFPAHELMIINVSQRISKLEKDEKAFRDVIAAVESSDGVLWAFPLYVCLVAAQYKRFIEMIWERGAAGAFRNKHAAVITTSVHFYDHTAHNYMNAICDDLGMQYAGSYSAEMYDLMKDRERERLMLFAEDFFSAVENKRAFSRTHLPAVSNIREYVKGRPENRFSIDGKSMLILTDQEDSRSNLARMVERFQDAFVEKVEVVNIRNIDMKGGCLGCCKCGYDNTCAYADVDGFMEFYNTRVRPADILVFAGAIRDRYLSSRWKMYFDRAFFNTHIPTLEGKQIGFIISGPLAQVQNLSEIVRGYCEWQRSNLVDIVTDEYEDSATIDTLLQGMAQELVKSSARGYVRPMTFRGVAGMKVFRDEVWGNLRFVFQADHRHYKTHGIYDFPQQNFKARRRNFIMTLLTGIPAFRKEFLKKIKEEMVKPLQHVVEHK